MFSTAQLDQIRISRRIPSVPTMNDKISSLSHNHCWTNDDIDTIISKIKGVLDRLGIVYKLPDSISTFSITILSGNNNDLDLNMEVRIFKEIDDELGLSDDGYIVDFYRYGGDGFLYMDILGKIQNEFVEDNQHTEPSDEELRSTITYFQTESNDGLGGLDELGDANRFDEFLETNM